MFKNTKNQFGSITKILHWSIFVLVTAMLLCGFFMEDLPESMQSMAYTGHKSTGILILGLMTLRLVWRCMNRMPALPAMPMIEVITARLVQVLLYVCLFVMPMTGWIASTAEGRIPAFYGLITMPFPGIGPNKALAHLCNTMHKTGAFVLLFLLALHIVGALKHHFIDKDDVLIRMMPEK